MQKANGARETIKNNPEERRRACSRTLASGMERRGRMRKKPRGAIGLGIQWALSGRLLDTGMNH